jgi:signal peptidase II
MSRYLLILFLLVGLVGCDQATKSLVRSTMEVGASISYLGDTVRLEHARNPGAFLSAGAGLSEPARFWVFNVLVGVFLTVLAWLLFRGRAKSAMAVSALALVLGGGIGNLIDRVLFGAVTDFLIVGVGPIRTGIFNVADMAIMLGIGLLLFTREDLWPAKKSNS